eukprot:6466490-Ditylum_brightwellii.AAC.1
MQCINYCWMYLNMTTLADIVLANGKPLDPHMYKGHKSLLSSSSKVMNTYQERPSDTSWIKYVNKGSFHHASVFKAVPAG